MNFEDALEQARADLERPVEVPAFARIEAAVRWYEDGAGADRPPVRMRWLATVGVGVAAISFAVDGLLSMAIASPVTIVLFVPVALLLLSAWLVHRGHLGSQLMARAIWWCVASLGLVWSAGPAELLPTGGTLVVVGCGYALLAVGRVGLNRSGPGRPFDPVAFRGTVLLSMMLGLADALLLAMVGTTHVEADGNPLVAAGAFGGAGLLALGVFGLYRLQVWAVGLNLSTNAATLILAWALLSEISLLPWALGASAALQFVLPTRMLFAFVRGRTGNDRRMEVPAGPIAVVLIVMMAVSIALGMFNTYTPYLP